MATGMMLYHDNMQNLQGIKRKAADFAEVVLGLPMNIPCELLSPAACIHSSEDRQTTLKMPENIILIHRIIQVINQYHRA